MGLQKLKEHFELVWLQWVVRLRKFRELFRVLIRYYRTQPQFFKADLLLLSQYLLRGPYTICKDYLLSQRAVDVYTYGETPITTLEYIATECGLTSHDRILDLGCGTGRTSLWLRLFVGCEVVGVEQVPTFVRKANRVTKRLGIHGLQFRLQDMRLSDYSSATAVYLYGTCLDDAVIAQLVRRFSVLPAGARIITVSYPLTDYTDDPAFKVVKQFPAQFTWGEADVYLHEVVR